MKYSLKGTYNSQNHFTLQKVENMKHLVSPSLPDFNAIPVNLH